MVSAYFIDPQAFGITELNQESLPDSFHVRLSELQPEQKVDLGLRR